MLQSAFLKTSLLQNHVLTYPPSDHSLILIIRKADEMNQEKEPS
jgi:hypothetical protein